VRINAGECSPPSYGPVVGPLADMRCRSGFMPRELRFVDRFTRGVKPLLEFQMDSFLMLPNAVSREV
jgi:hypothetical protein